jgi:putative FmdB family regulatory protein
MPMYEYECSNGHRFEEIQKFADPPLARCKKCKAKAKRLLSASNFALKGDGWYKDGYAKRSGDAAPAPEQPSTPNDTDFKEVAKRTREALIKRDFGG